MERRKVVIDSDYEGVLCKQEDSVSDRGYSYERMMKYPAKNPLTGLDYPDPDVIRVGDTYYMVSTTVHFMPGCEILRSYDLVHWEHLSYVYDTLDSTDGQRLEGEENIYGKGMWAASIRFHKGRFYICFVANDTHKTYLYTADNVEGPWEKKTIEGFYHDCSLLFDDDDKVYIVYGNKDVYLTQLKRDLSGPMEGGVHRLLVSDEGHPGLGYEGSHLYKINGNYYLFCIHSLRTEWRRVEACFMADSIEGEFRGGDVFNDDMGYCNQGVAQGGIVDTPEGKWYSILFQDRGAVGRIPVLIPLTWKDGYPVLGTDGRVPEDFEVNSTIGVYQYTPLVTSDDFKKASSLPDVERARLYGTFGFKSAWQFNHEPDMSFVDWNQDAGTVCVTTDKLCRNVVQARNVLTQRMLYPGCAGEVTVNAAGLKDGDYAGICALQGCYGMVSVTRRGGRIYVVMQSREADNDSSQAMPRDNEPGREWEAVPIEDEQLRLKVEVDFTDMKDEAKCYYLRGKKWEKIGITHKLYFKVDHFAGCRFGLFVFSTKQTGGKAEFSDFVYMER